MSAAADALLAAWCTAMTPPPTFTVSTWAEAERVLPESSSARGARWRNAAAPYLAGIMDAIHEPGVRQIAVMKAAQAGGSEALGNILGYLIAHDPAPILVVQPTVEIAEEWSKERLADMIRTTPALAAVVRDRRQPRGSHRPESTLKLKTFPGGFLAIGGANTPNTFARRAVRVALADDVDRFPPVVGDEGDPAALLVQRTTTFHDGLTIFVSTPTLAGGRIDTLYARSDQRRYVVTCPRCGYEDWIAWNDPAHFRIAFDARDPATARLQCPDPERGGCGAGVSDPERRLMIVAAAARPDRGWRPTATAQEPGLIGFHLPAMLATLGSISANSLVAEWLSARQRGRESLRVFLNTRLAEGWEDRGVKIEPHTLLARREDYGEAVEVPAAAPALSAGVDVQVNRFELHVFAWGPGAERWLVDARIIPGDPKAPETRAALLDALGRKYRHASGHLLPIHATCMDSGYATEEVYDFVLAHQARHLYATKGFAGRSGTPVVGRPSEVRTGTRSRPVRLYPINTDDAKADVLNAVLLPTPGPGSCHLPLREWCDEEYVAQLTAEHRETRYNKAHVATHQVWVQDRSANHALDLAVLALAAYRLGRLDVGMSQMAQLLAAAGVPAPSGAPTAATPPPAGADTPPGRRVGRSQYLGG